MSGRRVPLANNPNAANSPFRQVAAQAGKRTRAQATDPRELLYGQPPSKKQAVDLEHNENTAPRSLTRQSLAQQEAEAKLFSKRPSNAPPTAFEKKLAAARDGKKPNLQKPDPRLQKVGDKAGDSLENVRQWQKHYRKAFPQFVFYFESVPDDVRSKITRQIQFLGAVSSPCPHLPLL